jgi:hypothetical protein
LEVWWYKYYFSGMKSESVKIDAQIVERIRKQVSKTGQKISGFINVVLEDKLNEIDGVNGNSYAGAMASILRHKKEKHTPAKRKKK